MEDWPTCRCWLDRWRRRRLRIVQTRRPCQLSEPVTSGVTLDGGYAEVMIAEARGIASIPDELTSAEAAPFLCAGVTTYNALRNAGLRAGDLVAVQGIGGLGHLGVQFARHMGFRTVAIGRGLLTTAGLVRDCSSSRTVQNALRLASRWSNTPWAVW